MSKFIVFYSSNDTKSAGDEVFENFADARALLMKKLQEGSNSCKMQEKVGTLDWRTITSCNSETPEFNLTSPRYLELVNGTSAPFQPTWRVEVRANGVVAMEGHIDVKADSADHAIEQVENMTQRQILAAVTWNTLEKVNPEDVVDYGSLNIEPDAEMQKETPA
jgi:hypothetical protein